MSCAWEVSIEDVQLVLSQRLGIDLSLDDPELEEAFDSVASDSGRVEKAALYGDEMDEQIGYADDEIEAILRENGYADAS